MDKYRNIWNTMYSIHKHMQKAQPYTNHTALYNTYTNARHGMRTHTTYVYELHTYNSTQSIYINHIHTIRTTYIQTIYTTTQQHVHTIYQFTKHIHTRIQLCTDIYRIIYNVNAKQRIPYTRIYVQ